MMLRMRTRILLLRTLLLLGLLLTGGQKLMRWWLTMVARRKSDELFMLNLLLITLGLAWLTEHAGLSLALGAFVAGMLVAGVYLREFVAEGVQWVHIDIAGPSYNTSGPWGYTPKGGTGVPTRTLFAVLEDIAANG